jgi:hypothetical protein
MLRGGEILHGAVRGAGMRQTDTPNSPISD